MKIGILECGPTLPAISAVHGTYPEIFARLLAAPGRSFAAWSVYRGAFPDSVASADAWLLTGSRHGVYDPLPFIAPLERFVRDAAAGRHPMVGICFGHQIMAQALGGTVVKSPKGWGFGRQVYDMDGVGPLGLNAIHQDQVTCAPTGARIIARNAFCPCAGMRYGTWGLSIQAHPEFGRQIMADFIDIKAQDREFPTALIPAARDSLSAPLNDGQMMAMIDDFLFTALGHPRHPDGQADGDAAPLPPKRGPGDD